MSSTGGLMSSNRTAEKRDILFEGKVALVTGAGSGLGLATVKAFAESGASVVLADWNETSVRSAAEALKAQGHRALAIPCDVADDARVMGINLRGVWSCMKFELQQMRKQGSGTIVNCSSLGGLVGGAERGIYHAAKHGVLGFTKRLRMWFSGFAVMRQAT